MSIRNSFVNTNLMRLFRAKALSLFDCLKPRPEVRGNSNYELTQPIMSSKKQAKIFHFDLYGNREEEYEFLNQQSIDSIPWTELEVEEPYFFFVKKDFASAFEFEAGFKIDELFTLNNVGIATGKDSDLVSYGKTDLEEKYLQKAIKYSYRPFDNPD